jgi:hypothetical protein
VAHHDFWHVGLPVRVGDEADRGVERDAGGDRAAAEVEGQQRLQPLEQVEHDDRDEREPEHACRVDRPALLGVRVGAHDPVDHPLDGEVSRVGEHPRQVVAKRFVHGGERDEQDGDL